MGGDGGGGAGWLEARLLLTMESAHRTLRRGRGMPSRLNESASVPATMISLPGGGGGGG